MLERIFMLMEERGINAARLTSDLEIANSSVSDWKRGKSKPGLETIIKIADYFGVTTDYLLGKSDNPMPPHLSQEAKTPSVDELIAQLGITNEKNIIILKGLVEMMSANENDSELASEFLEKNKA